jgi:hypothetical protein
MNYQELKNYAVITELGTLPPYTRIVHANFSPGRCSCTGLHKIRLTPGVFLNVHMINWSVHDQYYTVRVS